VTLEGWEAFSFAKLEEAKAQGKIAVLYFTAAWCEGCHDLEARALQDPRVQAAL
jgi:thiol:disulfide interchange protein